MSAIDAEKLYQIVGQRIREKRDQAFPRISQAQLAEALGLERTSITNIERGTQRAPLNLLYEICTKLELEITELIPEISDVLKGQQSSLVYGEEVTIGAKSVSVSQSPKTAQFIESLTKRA